MPEASPLVIGLDCSTSACKAVVWDCAGNPLAQGFAPLPLLTPQPGWHEQSAESWWDAASLALRQVASQVDPRRLKALSIAHQRETFVPVDQSGQPLTNAILWMDERAAPLLPELETAFGRSRFHHLTGKQLSVNLTVAKIAWLRKFHPDVFTRVYKYLDVHAYLVYRLTGLYRTAWGSADPTGLFDTQRKHWAVRVLDYLNISPAQLPDVFPPGTVLGTLSPSAAEVTSLPVGLPVVAGVGDGQACGLGAEINSPGSACLSLGNSLISGTYSDRYLVNSAFRTMSGGILDSFILETVILGGTYTLDWFMQTMVLQPGQDIAALQASLDQSAGALPPGSQGLIVVPYWNSVLGPYWDPTARGIMIGLRGFHKPHHIYRAILEGLAFEQLLNTRLLEKAIGLPMQRFIAIGGGARSDLWCQIIADMLGKPLFRLATSEAAALGAGILASVGAGCFPDARQAAQAMTHTLPHPFEPDPAPHAVYLELFEHVYQPLFPALRSSLHRLHSLSQAQESGGELSTPA